MKQPGLQWLCGNLICLLLSWLPVAQAHDGHPEQDSRLRAVSVAADQAGHLWMVQVKHGHVLVSVSQDAGQHFAKEVAVNAVPMQVAANAEARPHIAVGPEGYLYVTWTESLQKSHAGYIWFARSVDGGKSFETPYMVHQHVEQTSHRYDVLQVAKNGNITVAWSDNRDAVAAKATAKPYAGSAIYYAVSGDQGKSFSPEQKLADGSCECCRIAMTSKPDGTVAALWRHVFDGGERDQAMAEIRPGSQSVLVRASYGHWKLHGCPHHGGALAVGEGFGYHLAYFDGAGDRPGLRIARMDDHAWVTSPPRRIGEAKKHAGHPALLSLGDQVWLAWLEHDAAGHEAWAMASKDGGRTWGPPSRMLHSVSKLDYPEWLNLRGSVMLAVNTVDKGLQLIPFTE